MVTETVLIGKSLAHSLLHHFDCRLVVFRCNATLMAEVILWWSVTHMFPGFLTPVLTQVFFPKPLTTFLTCFCRGERRKHAGKKSRLNWGSNSQPTSHELDTLTTEPLKPQSFPKAFCFNVLKQVYIEERVNIPDYTLV